MCVAIYKPLGLKLDDETLRNCFITNPDGCGFAYIEAETGELRIQKFMTLPNFMAAYKEKQDMYIDSSPFLIHFRIKTHGLKDLDNCHPFQIDNEHVFIHNGIIRTVPDCHEKKKSDTRMFKELILRKLPEGWFDNEAITQLIEEYIGSFSKLAVMNKEGVVHLYNESKGSWKDGVWFSNLLWEPRAKTTKHHADFCFNCNAYIKNNIYANTQGVSFCSIKCKDAYTKSAYTWKDVCEMCNKTATQHIYRGNTEYHYCSDYCRREHTAIMDRAAASRQKEKQNKNNVVHAGTDKTLYLECCYCGIHHPATTCIELEIKYADITEKEFMCIDCVDAALAAGYIEDSPDLAAAVCAINEELKQEREQRKAGTK